MSLEALSCPKCGAPLKPPPLGDSWLCLYCNSLIRVPAESGASPPRLEKDLDPEAMNSVKQLLISGQRAEAAQRLQQLTGLDAEAARREIDRMAADFSLDTLFHQQLTPLGIALVMLSLVVLPASLLAWWAGWLDPWLAIVYSGLAGFELFVYGRGALTTLRYRNAPVAPATTLHFTPIGAVRRGRLRVHTFLVVLEVRPQEGSPFQAQVVIPVRAENLSRVQQGAGLQVKYLPEVPDSVIYHQS